jgi:quercetin dioxygenase-like cupin family protein
MKLHDWKQIPIEPMNELVGRQAVHTGRTTHAHIHLKSGAVVPRHSHENEQVTTVLEGRLKFLFDDEEVIVAAGQSLEIPSNAPHRVEALVDSLALDIFAPARADWIRGDDAYLRQR